MKPFLIYLGPHRLSQEGAACPGRRPQGADLREGRRNGRALQQKVGIVFGCSFFVQLLYLDFR